jgi:hypothetical protein
MRCAKPALVAAALLSLVVFSAPRAARALDLGKLLGHGENDPTLETFKLIRVADLKNLIADPNAKIHIYDANVLETREKFGVIPGATLLSSDDKYDLSVLPSDKHAKLVFYCANWL